MATSYKTIEAIKYHSPVYIHSHPTNFTDVFKSVSGVMRKAQNDTRNKLLGTIRSLESVQKNAAVQEFYYSTHDANGKRKMDNKGQMILNRLLEVRNQLELIKQEQGDAKLKKLYEAQQQALINELNDTKNSGKTLQDILGEEFSKNFTQFLNQEGTLYNIKKLTNASEQDVVNKFFNKNTGQITKYFEDRVLKFLRLSAPKTTEVKKIMAKLKKDIEDYIKTFGETANTFLSSTDVEKLLTRTQKLSSHGMASFAVSGTGFSFETIFNFLIASTLAGTDIILGDQPVSLKGSSASATGHELTTDNIISLIDDLGQKINIGFSLKNVVQDNQFDTVFHKTVNKQNFFLNRYFRNDKEAQSLLYYAANQKALSIFQAPGRYNRVVQLTPEEAIHLPPNQPTLMSHNIISDIRRIYVSLCTIQALVGYFYYGKNVTLDDMAENQVPPVLLSFGEYDY